MDIKFLDLKRENSKIYENIKGELDEVFCKNNFIKGEPVDLFEKKFAEYNDIKFCVSCANGTDALELAVKSLGLTKNDEIIVQGNTYIASALSIINNNHKVVLCDIDPTTNMICIDNLISKINENTKAIIVVHLYGIVPDMDKIINIVNKNNLFLIEDCAQAHGALWKNKHVGTFGDIGCFSFYPGKNLGAFGDAGCIITNNQNHYINIKKMANLGCEKKYYHDIIGRNSRMDTIQAVVLNEKLKYLDENNHKRLKNANIYENHLFELSNIILPKYNKDSLPVFHLYVIIVEERDELKKYLKTKNIDTLIHYPISICETDAFKSLNIFADLKHCISNSKKILSLPMYPDISPKEIKYVCDSIKEFYNSSFKTMTINKIITPNKPGFLSNINIEDICSKLNIHFNYNHMFYITDLNNNLKRGCHSNSTCCELIVCLNGSFTINLDNKRIKETILINQNDVIYIPNNTWIELMDFNNCTALVFVENYTSELNNQKCYSYEEFLSST